MKKVSIFLLAFLMVFCITAPSYARRPKRCDSTGYRSPCWMSDSQHIIYIKHVRHTKYNYGWLASVSKSGIVGAGNDYYICRMDMETREEEVIAQFSMPEYNYEKKFYLIVGKEKKKLYEMITPYNINCAPNGKLLCFTSGDGIYTMNIDGSGLKKVAGNGSCPKFSSDSKQMFFGHYEEVLTKDGKRIRLNGGLWLMNADGSDKRFLAESAIDSIWHPNEKKIYFRKEGKKFSYEKNNKTYNTYIDGGMFSVNINGTDEKRVSAKYYKRSEMNFVAFQDEKDEHIYINRRGNLYLKENKNAEPVLISKNVAGFDWNRKGDRLLYNVLSFESYLKRGHQRTRKVYDKYIYDAINKKSIKAGKKFDFEKARGIYYLSFTDEQYKQCYRYNRPIREKISGKKLDGLYGEKIWSPDKLKFIQQGYVVYINDGSAVKLLKNKSIEY